MTFQALVALFDKYRRTFFGMLGLSLLIAGGMAHREPPVYVSELLLSVTRTAVPAVSEYAYDQFYRFQADERMADTLTQYLSSETGKRAVGERAKLDTAAYQEFTDRKLVVARLGTNLVRVTYKTSSLDQASRIGNALTRSANDYVYALNEDAKQKEWFMVIGEQPVTRSALWGWGRWLLIGLVVGIVVGFWSVLWQNFWHHYREEQYI